MSHKVDISEVTDFSNDLKSMVADLKSSLTLVSKHIDKLNAMQSFSGKTAIAAKNYFNELHKTLLKSFELLFNDLDENLKKHIKSFQSRVDSSQNALIESNYLRDLIDNIDDDFDRLMDESESVKDTIRSVSDITSVSIPYTYSLESNHKTTIKDINKLDRELGLYTSIGRQDISQIDNILNHLQKAISNAGAVSGDARFKEIKGSAFSKVLLTLNSFVDVAQKGEELVTGITSSYTIYKAAKNKGLSVSKYTKNGKVMYRINATEDALKALGITPDSYAHHAIKKSKKNRFAPLNYYDRKTGTQIWSNTGKDVIDKYPAMRSWNDKASVAEKAKTVARETGRGTLQGLKDTVDIRGITKSGVLKGASKALGPLSVGLSYYSNLHDAKADGLIGKDAHSRAVTDTAVDVTISTAVQVAFTVAGTAFIPIPGVGTAVGVVAGMAANWVLNKGIFKDGKSIMDKAKGVFRKIKGWFN